MRLCYYSRVCAVFFLGVLFCAGAANAGTTSEWPMFHHDAQHTGQSANNGPQTSTLKWSYSASSGNSSNGNTPPDTPSISSDGLTLYTNVSGLNGVAGTHYVIAISTDNGTVKWSQSVEGSGATAVASDGTVYAAGGTKLYAYTSDGTLKWTFTSSTDNIHGEPCIGADGTIYIGSWDTYVYAVNPDGSLKWKYQTAGAIAPLASPTLSADGSVLYVGSGDPHKKVDGTLYALLTSNGSLKWSNKIDSNRASGAVVGMDGTIYATGNKMLHAFKSDGTQLWQSASGTAENLTPALSSSGILYVGTGSTGMIYALNATTGATLWSYQTGVNPSYPVGPQYGVLTAPVIGADSTVYVGSVDGKIYALKSDGSLLWTYLTSAAIQEDCPAIGPDGTLYFSSDNTYLYAVKDNTTTYTLTVSKSGTGTVTSSPSGISCGSSCSASYTSGASVALSASAASGYSLKSWTGCDNASATQCTVAMTSNKTVTAVFTAAGMSDNDSASAAFDAIYAQYASWFGSKSGGISAYSSNGVIYYVQWYTNGAALVAGTDGYLYTYYNGQWYGLGITWKTYGEAASKISEIYAQYASWFGTKSSGIVSGTSGAAVYYIQWFSNGAALVAWTDGYMYTYYNGTSYALGISWR